MFDITMGFEFILLLFLAWAVHHGQTEAWTFSNVGGRLGLRNWKGFSFRPQQYQGAKLRERVGLVTLPWPVLVSSKKSDEKEWSDDDQDYLVAGPEKSQMTNYILDYLKKQKPDDNNNDADDDETTTLVVNGNHTHLVAIPMEDCHELLLELESVQRAILYHCPVLVHACMPQAVTRLPLLYVTVNDAAASTENKLFHIVNDVVRQTLIDNQPSGAQKGGERSSSSTPFMLSFKTLEMDGSKNEALHTVALDENAATLRRMVEKLQERIQQETGWKTEIPPDPHSDVFRPRIPFMRLPNNWEDILSQEIRAKNGDEESRFFLTADEGGNGISPILWYKWREDDFGMARMREVAVYKSNPKNFQGLNEASFKLPFKSIELPLGDANLTQKELKFRDYQENRMMEAERFLQEERAKDEKDQFRSSGPDIAEDDWLLEKTRNRLELLYNASASETTPLDILEQETTNEVVEKARPEDPSAMDDWTRQRIQQILATRAKVKSEQELARTKNKPPVERNEIFAKYKEGTLVPKQEDNAPKQELPPFPSREHCTGFWRVVASPTGFDVEEGDASRSDNLILRVDGTTAGGPILDKETRQKASGGTWRFQGSSDDDASMLIRLVIPPKKERVLVMKGRLVQGFLSSEFTLAGSSFGIPEIEKLKAKSALADTEGMIHCSGTVWIEDAITKANRRDIGTFTLMKLNISTSPDSYTITVPRPVRNQD